MAERRRRRQLVQQHPELARLRLLGRLAALVTPAQKRYPQLQPRPARRVAGYFCMDVADPELYRVWVRDESAVALQARGGAGMDHE